MEAKLAGLKVPKARQLGQLLTKGRPFARPLKIFQQPDTGQEAIVFEVEVELGQKQVVPITRFEPIAAVFAPEDRAFPDVLALREDFPITSHQNMRPYLRPRSLCLYEATYEEVKATWTASAFVERIRDWLRKAAIDQLHDPDQAMEPLFFSSEGIALLSRQVLSELEANETIPISAGVFGTERKLIFSIRKNAQQQMPGQGPRPIVTLVKTPPILHGIIRSQPENLLQVADACKEAGLDLLDVLGKRIMGWRTSKSASISLESKLILAVIFPKVRRSNGPAEDAELWLFLTLSTVKEIGLALDVIQTKYAEGYAVPIIDTGATKRIIDSARLAKVAVAPLKPVFFLDRASAAKLNGQVPDQRHLVAVGSGTLGSQIIANLARAGFGRWTIIDHDYLLPHNCARHFLDGSAVGLSKAEVTADRLRWTLDSAEAATPIVADVLNPGGEADSCRKAFESADAILDFAASSPVSRHLAAGEAKARRVALFLNPAGTDLVMLAEDSARQQTLDWLEMQYLSRVCHDPSLAGHLESAGGKVRYSRGCSDVTTQLDQEVISVHAGFGAKAVRKALASNDAQILILKVDAEALSVAKVGIPALPPLVEEKKNWHLLFYSAALAKAHALARSRLPNETGGILVGSFDVFRKRVYVLDVLTSPPDSKEWPHLYIRGVIGLRKQLKKLSEKSGGNLAYVGEWHSHTGADATASNTDKIALRHLTDEMGTVGLPGLMLIVARQNSSRSYLSAEQ